MKRLLIFLFLFIFTSIQANSKATDIDVDFDRVGGVYSLYQFDTLEMVTPPSGFRPFYISHYGRHGARFVLTDREYNNVYNVLVSAHENEALNDRGEQLYKQYIALYPSFYKRGGDLTSIGQEQHYKLAQRMVEAYPEVFRIMADEQYCKSSSQCLDNIQKVKVEAQSTIIPRCILSMASFCQGLIDATTKPYSLSFVNNNVPSHVLDISSSASKSFMSYLNPYNSENPKVFEGDSDSKSSYSKRMMNEFFEQKINTSVFASRLFKDSEYAVAHYDIDRFMQDLFMIASDMQCLAVEDLHLSSYDIKRLGLDDNHRKMHFFFDYFSPEEMIYLWEWENMRFYIEKGPSLSTDGRSFRLSESLLNELIVRTDADIAAAEPQVRLRFGHDACIMGLYCLMELDGWGEVTTVADSVKYCWQSYNIPMAANLQMVFYRNQNNDIIFRFLHNEHDLKLPIDVYYSSKNGGNVFFYRWEDFKRKYEPIVRKACDFIDESGEATIYGQVIYDGRPLQGIEVSDGVISSVTDERGYYFLKSDKQSQIVKVLVPPSNYNQDYIPGLNKSMAKTLSRTAAHRERVDFIIN